MAVVNRIGQTQPWFNTVEVGVGRSRPGRDVVPAWRRRIPFEKDRALRGAVGEDDARLKEIDVEAIDERFVIQPGNPLACIGECGRAVRILSSPETAGQANCPFASLFVWDCKVEVVSRVIGQGDFAVIGRFESDFQAAFIEPVNHIEYE